MHTMHPVVVLGSYRWDQERLPRDEFEERLRAVRRVMAEQGWDGLVIHGNAQESALLTYLTNFYPRLRWTLGLVGHEGEPRLLVAGGTRDLPAAAMLTWVRDVGWYGHAEKVLPEWLESLPPAASGERRVIGVAGRSVMRRPIHDTVFGVLREHAATADADPALLALLRVKRPRELALVRQACAILDETIGAIRRAHQDGAPATASVVEGERAARRAEAQDIRILFSLDGGRTLQPFEELSEARPDPLAVYVAARYLGYWSDAMAGFAASRSPVQARADELLSRLVAAVRPGATGDALAALVADGRGTYDLHPSLGGCVGHGIGLSPEEPPRLSPGSADALAAGQVCALRVALLGADGGFGAASAMVVVRDGASEILCATP